MNKELLKQKACEAIDANCEKICEIGRSIYTRPELGYKEIFASELVTSVFKELNLKPETNLAITGVKAKLKENQTGINVGVLGELDAVVCPEHPDADQITGAAHCCGHFGQIAGMLGCAMGLNAVKEELEGNVTFMAVPAEECVEIEYRQSLIQKGKISYLGGKQEMLHRGDFDDIDLAMMIHGSNTSKTITACSQSVGFIAKTARFIGKEAHAGGAPWNGVNALNAASLALMAINSIRETLKDQDCIRIHPIITKGGTLVNIVPNDVRMEMYVRGASIEAIKDANQKVNRAIKGAAYTIGCDVEIDDLPGYLPVHGNQDLGQVFARNAQMICPKTQIVFSDKTGGGSSDIGDVMNVMPCIEGSVGGFVNEFHTKDFRLDNEELAFIVPAKIMACTVIDLLDQEGEAAKQILQNYKSQYTTKTYDDIWKNIMEIKEEKI